MIFSDLWLGWVKDNLRRFREGQSDEEERVGGAVWAD